MKGSHHPHAHSHRERRRGPRIYTEAKLEARARRLERLRDKPRVEVGQEIVIRVLGPAPNVPPAGQRSGRMDRSGPLASRYVLEAIDRRKAEEAAREAAERAG